MTRALTFAFCAAAALALLPAAQDAFAQAAGQAKIQVAEKQPFGKYLTDAEGRSLYLFEADSKNQSTCYDACAEAWPPLLTDGEPAVEGADPSKLSTVERTDGKTQVAYNGWPLYYFIKDQQPGDTTGQDVEGFGGEWYLVSPEGEKVHAEGEKQPS